jgi:DNA-binding IclR family transcriptional regulator
MIAVKETGYLHMGSVKNAEDGKKYIQSVERALKIMNLIADQGNMRLGAVSEAMGLKVTTTFGLLQTLEHMGYLSRGENDMEYCLGMNSLKAGLCFEAKSGMSSVIHTLLTELVEAIDETAYFEIRIGEKYYYYDVVLSKQPLKVVPDQDRFITLPENSAVSKVYGRRTQNGYATDLEEVEKGLNCFAVPFYSGGEMVGCVALTGPSYRFTKDRMKETYQTYCEVMDRLHLYVQPQ